MAPKWEVSNLMTVVANSYIAHFSSALRCAELIWFSQSFCSYFCVHIALSGNMLCLSGDFGFFRQELATTANKLLTSHFSAMLIRRKLDCKELSDYGRWENYFANPQLLHYYKTQWLPSLINIIWMLMGLYSVLPWISKLFPLFLMTVSPLWSSGQIQRPRFDFRHYQFFW
jgi:hypothetical protein